MKPKNTNNTRPTKITPRVQAAFDFIESVICPFGVEIDKRQCVTFEDPKPLETFGSVVVAFKLPNTTNSPICFGRVYFDAYGRVKIDRSNNSLESIRDYIKETHQLKLFRVLGTHFGPYVIVGDDEMDKCVNTMLDDPELLSFTLAMMR